VRLLYVAKSAPGLSETFIRDEMRFFRSRGHSVHLVCERPHKASEAALIGAEYVDALHLVSPPDGFRRLAWKAAAEVRKRFGNREAHGTLAMARRIEALGFRPDALIAHFGPNVLLASHVKRHLDRKPPLVGVFHGYDLSLHVRKHSSAEYLRHADNIDLFVAISEHGNRALRSFGIDHKKIKTIHLGVNQSAIPAPAKRNAPDSFSILSVGRLVEKKGFDTLIDAFAMLPPATLTRSDLTIIGNGPQYKQLLGLAENRGVSAKVHFLSALPHPETLQRIANSSVFVLASRTSKDGDMEGIPVVLMEAMATGSPVVATRHAGIPELIDDGVTGLLVPESDPKALAEALQRVADDSESSRARILAAQQKIRLNFNREKQNRILEDEISTLVAGGRTSAMH
jgi:colanic acid/amylovoran/stewartan biosynthesis glycosyltransferase WcaL/AmsK/CpsK